MMSDPMTKVEIEDVLSSIRRLVSEDQTGARGSSPRAEPLRPAAMYPRPMPSAPPPAASSSAEPLAAEPQPAEPETAEPETAESETAARDVARLAAEDLSQDLQGAELEGAEAQDDGVQDDGSGLAEPVPATEPDLAEQAPEPEPQPDPLVLTPALRVARPDAASLRASLEETIAELEAAISGSDGEWEPDGGEMAQMPIELDAFAASLVAAVSAGPATAEAEPAMEAVPEEGAPMDAESQDAGDVGLPGLDALQEDVPFAKAEGLAGGASPVRLVTDTGDARPEGLWSQYPETMEWAAPGDLAEEGTPEASTGAELAGEAGAGEASAIGEIAEETREGEGLELGDEGLELAAEGPDQLAANPDPEPDLAERFWAAEAEDAGSAEPDFPEAGPTRSDAPDWQDEFAGDGKPRRLHLAGGLGWGAAPPISAAGRGWSRGEPEDGDLLEAEEEDTSLFDDVEDVVLDEAALRALVSEIIRQELQGTLGERITRSVRKLVRREIQRALASRDFE